jgi:hypothetical protein
MSNLNSALQQLRDERKQAQVQVEKLDQAIAVIEGLSGRTIVRSAGSNRRGRRMLSAEARRRISEAQRARWAARKKQSGATAGPRPVPANRKPLSAAARRKIAAAQKARWAKFRSQQKAA